MRAIVRVGAAVCSLIAAGGVAAQNASGTAPQGRLEEVTVTAQKRSENIQDVPIAVTAFSENDLALRNIGGGPEILAGVPNVTFSKGNFTGYNLQIRGVGTKLISGNADFGVGIHKNNAPLTVSRFFEAEFYDVERIEVLRGPQGTVYGRNATGGVFNVISAKPTSKLEGNLSVEGGTYDTLKLKGMINLPLGEDFAFRLAGSSLRRDGFVHELVHDTEVDGRDLWSARATLAFVPNDRFSSFLLWERFDENDDRQRVGKQLCTKDTGPASVGGVATSEPTRRFLTQGCLPGSLYSDSAFSVINGNATLGGVLSNASGVTAGDAFAGKTVSRDLRDTESFFLPTYRARSDIAQLNLEFALTPQLTVTSLSSWFRDNLNSTEDYNRATPLRNFNVVPGVTDAAGNVPDPQVGNLNFSAAYDVSFARFKQKSQELRLQSSFDGPVNFNVGAIYIDLDSPVDGGFYVLFNTGTAYARCFNLGPCNTDPATGVSLGAPAEPIFIDPNNPPTGLGHNYYLNLQAYELNSAAGFGEIYWQQTPTFKWTLGVRYTHDKKEVVNYPVTVAAPGIGFRTTPLPGQPSSAIYSQNVTFSETTGRFGADWQLSDEHLLYAFYSKGYKAGGFNPAQPGSVNVNQSFDPELVNAFELGSKNSFANGDLLLNATGFYYDYGGYQISRIVNLTTITDNIDARIYGLELEGVWQPLDGLRFDGNVGYLRTRITSGSSVDVMNRTQGNPNLTLVKSVFTSTNCVIPTAVVAGILQAAPAALGVLCPEGLGRPLPLGLYAGVLNPAASVADLDGVPVNLDGRQLPNSPRWTMNFGAQQTWGIGGNWTATLRGDVYRQTSSFARVYNTQYDQLKAWSNANVAVDFANETGGWDVLFRVKNVLDKEVITDAYLTDDSSGLWTNVFLTDPRLYTLMVTKRF